MLLLLVLAGWIHMLKRMDTNVMNLIGYLIWILMIRMDTNVMMDYEFDTGWV